MVDISIMLGIVIKNLFSYILLAAKKAVQRIIALINDIAVAGL